MDSRKFAFDVYNDVLRHFGKRTFTSEEFCELFSSDYRVHLKRVGINSAREVNFLVDMWNARFATDGHKFKLYDGILNVLTYFYKRNYKMALVSSNSLSQLQLYFDLFGIDKFFSVTIAKEDIDEQKPSAKPILQAAKRLNVSPHDCAVIDDTEDGIKAAKKLGSLTIGVTWGFHNIYQFTDEELKEIDEKATRDDYEAAALCFHGVKMYKDAARYKVYKQTGRFPMVTRSTDLSSLREVLSEDARFPCIKQQLLLHQGWKVIDLTKTKRVHASEILEKHRNKPIAAWKKWFKH